MSTTNTTSNSDSGLITALLFMLPIFYGAIIFASSAFNKLNTAIALSLYAIMSLFCAIIIAIEKINQRIDPKVVLQNFIATALGWCFYAPIYFFSKGNEKSRTQAVYYGFICLILTIGTCELFRFNIASDSKFSQDYGLNYVKVLIAILIASPIVISHWVKSINFNIVVLQSLTIGTALLLFLTPHNVWTILIATAPTVAFNIYLASHTTHDK